MGSDPTRIQFFIRMNPTRVFVANSTDSIRSIQERIQSTTGIPVTKQRLIYRGSHLQSNRTLAECGVGNDAELHLVCRMRSMEHNQATEEVVNDIISLTRYLSKKKTPTPPVSLKSMVVEFLNLTPKDDVVKASAHLHMFASSTAPRELVMLYVSSDSGEAADVAIREFIVSSKRVLPKHAYHLECAPVVFEFHTLLIEAGRTNGTLYQVCSSTLRGMVVDCSECGEKQSVQIPFFRELVAGLSRDLDLCAKKTPFPGTPPCLVADFTYFLVHLRKEIEKDLAFRDPVVDIPLCCTESITYLHRVFVDLLCKLEKWLVEIEKCVMIHGEALRLGGGAYLRLLKGLYSISKLYSGGEDVFRENLKQQKNAFSGIVLLNAKSFEHDDYNSILEFKELINFEARKHLAMLMLPQMQHGCVGLYKMLINRSDLLAESFEYIEHADPESLRSGLSVVFNKEKAYGHGVQREWFLLVCQEIVNPLHALFLTCPNDQRRIFPNPASRVDPLHLDYFSFCGRLIALTLMHRVQVGIVLDRVFFLLLAGHSISLEDIQDADPLLYKSCKHILEMDPEAVDQDDLGLTFVHEIEELGKREVFELFPGGGSMVVNSKNRNQFVDSLIKHRFVTAISEQVAHFARGFSDIMDCQWPHQSFFRCLDLKDLDRMLHGSESAISVGDWKAHTDCHGFKETDPQISWFWEIVTHMPMEQKRALLFFWTSIKYLPVEDFSGLPSRLCIYKTDESCDRLPTSRTCFSQLCLPAYPSFSIMRDHLNIITQEHASCSFGIP